jgi:hypothetical protein
MFSPAKARSRRAKKTGTVDVVTVDAPAVTEIVVDITGKKTEPASAKFKVKEVK